MNLAVFLNQIRQCEVLLSLQGKRILIIGDSKYATRLRDGSVVPEEMIFAHYVVANGGEACVYVLQNTRYDSRMTDLPEVLPYSKYQKIILLAGLELEHDPCVALQNLCSMLTDDGDLFIVCRTPKFLHVRDRLMEYEDLWRFTASDFEDIFGQENVLVYIDEPTGHYLAVDVKYKKGHKLQPKPLFATRVERPIWPSELPVLGFFAEYVDLDKVGGKYNTDKNRYNHNYLQVYEFFLQKHKEKEFNLLELGVFKGGSAKMWAEYFTKAMIHCVDIDEECRKYAAERIIPHIMDLGIEENVASLKKIQPLVIVDDASHLWSHQLLALSVLYECLPTGGVYILEDLESSLNPRLYPDMEGGSQHNVFAVISRIAKVVGSKEPEEPVDELSPMVSYIGLKTDMISLIKGSCIFIKR